MLNVDTTVDIIIAILVSAGFGLGILTAGVVLGIARFIEYRGQNKQSQIVQSAEALAKGQREKKQQ